MDTPNSAVAKIGYQLRDTAQHFQRASSTEIRWKGGKPYFLCGVNVNAQAVTISFNRSLLLEMIEDLDKNAPIRKLFLDLVKILDPDADEDQVDQELDEMTAAMDDGVSRLQR